MQADLRDYCPDCNINNVINKQYCVDKKFAENQIFQFDALVTRCKHRAKARESNLDFQTECQVLGEPNIDLSDITIYTLNDKEYIDLALEVKRTGQHNCDVCSFEV